MKIRPFFVVAFLFGMFAAFARADEASDKADVAQVERTFSAVLAKNDPKALGEIIVPEWRIVLSDGSLLTREQLLGLLESGKLRFTENSIDALDVRLYGDVAVVIGVARSKGVYENANFTSRERFTDVLVRREGKWRCVSSHNSELGNE